MSTIITIQQTDNNGYVVNVGCKVFVFSDRDVLLQELEAYLQNPETVTKTYSEKYRWSIPEPGEPTIASRLQGSYMGGGGSKPLEDLKDQERRRT